MNVLIVESKAELGRLWRRHLERQGAVVDVSLSGEQSILAMTRKKYDVIVLDLILDDGGALSVADFASYRQPEARILFVTDTSFFSDGSIFLHSPNACGYVQSETPPEDLAAMVAHYGAPNRSRPCEVV